MGEKNEGDAIADAVTQNTDERDAECTSLRAEYFTEAFSSHLYEAAWRHILSLTQAALE